MIDSMNVDGTMRRKGLLVLPCGVGKTRTAVALSKILIKNDWVQNVLFLADRNNLVSNALKPFSKYIEGGVSDISAENPERDTNARICLCTYNSMLNFLNKPKKEFSVGHFDLIFVDEAHRSLFNVYRAIFEYFDSFVIGLTATPSKAIDRSTYEILDLNTDEPTFEVKFEEAVNLNCLVSYRAFDKTSDVMKNGLKYMVTSPRAFLNIIRINGEKSMVLRRKCKTHKIVFCYALSEWIQEETELLVKIRPDIMEPAPNAGEKRQSRQRRSCIK